jgi:protocatechuate 3,4-dioxygenase beta subunit
MAAPDERNEPMDSRITRRQALHAAGSAGAALLVSRGAFTALGELAAAAPAAAATTKAAVAVTPSMTEGPYWIDEMLRRFDVRANTASASSSAGAAQAGAPLALTIEVLDAANGGAINGAHVDIWHANAYGLYSGEGGQPGGTDTSGQNFLRGYQVTGVDRGALAAPVDGQVNFRTIWPGWYTGRAIHIHVRVRTYGASGAVATDYTTQIFFSDVDNAAVLDGAAPYNTRSPKTDPTTDETDNVLTASADATNIVPVTGSLAEGFAATFRIGLQGVASSVSGAGALTASLASAKVTATALVLTVTASETVTAHASLVRSGHVLGRATGKLGAGTHTLKVALAGDASPGRAIARVVLADAAGATKTFTKPVVVPPSA